VNPEIKRDKEIENKEMNPEDQVATGTPVSRPRETRLAFASGRFVESHSTAAAARVGPRAADPACQTAACFTGILFVLRSVIPWEMLPQEPDCGSGMTCWRSLQHDAAIEKQSAAERSEPEWMSARPSRISTQLSATGLRTRHGSPYSVAVAYASLHQRDEAMKYLHLARQQANPGLSSFRLKFAFRFLHSDPEFRDLVIQLGLPPV
jgi:hypothetical protein